MTKNEMIEKLMKKFNVTREEAEKALEICDNDLLDAVIYLEKKKRRNNDDTLILDLKKESEYKEEKEEGSLDGIREILRRVCKVIGKIIRKGNESSLNIKKNNEKPIKIPLTLLVILLFVCMPLVLILAVVGLFCGYEYTLSGKKSQYDSVNTVFKEVSKTATIIKDEVKNGYEEK